MKAFEYAGPTSVDDALKLLGGTESAAALSGGTDLIGRMKDYVTSPERVVYLKDIKALSGI
ncbi:MAG: FAD binding domain-containing protein, partial [Isosphaeraceae bacterium]